MNVPIHLDLEDSGPAPVVEPKPKAEKSRSQPTEEVENLIVLEEESSTPGGEDVFVLADDSAQAPPPKSAPASSSKLGVKPDSDVRLEKSDRKTKKKSDDSDSIVTEEIDLGVMAGGSSGKLTGSSKKKLSPSSSKINKGGSGKISNLDKTTVPPEEDSSEFELSLDVDSSDEFELSLSEDSSGEISLGDVSAGTAGPRSGINLGNPLDSGLSLEDSGTGVKMAAPRVARPRPVRKIRLRRNRQRMRKRSTLNSVSIHPGHPAKDWAAANLQGILQIRTANLN